MESKKSKRVEAVKHNIPSFSFIWLALFILFLNWVAPELMPSWIPTIAFWYVVFVLFVLVIFGAVILVIMVISAFL